MIINWKEIIGQEQKGISGNYSFYNGGWVKKVEAVDKSQSNGYCFEGKFVRGATEGMVEIGDGFYIVCSIEGSRKNQRKEYAVYRLTGEQVDRIIGWVTGKDWGAENPRQAGRTTDGCGQPGRAFHRGTRPGRAAACLVPRIGWKRFWLC